MTPVSRVAADITEIENTWIALSDGCRLAARLWLPPDAEKQPVPAILEYLPYRKRDTTAERDALNHAYFAANGYAGVRVDLRGCGDSDGIILGEYLQQEQDTFSNSQCNGPGSTQTRTPGLVAACDIEHRPIPPERGHTRWRTITVSMTP